MKHAHVAETLTRAEREAPFQLGMFDPEPLPRLTRTARVVNGAIEFEIDPATGEVLAERTLEPAP